MTDSLLLVPQQYFVTGNFKSKKKTKTTSLGFHKPQANRELLKMISENILDKSCFWFVELDTSGYCDKILENLIIYSCKEINIASPNLPIFLWSTYELLMELTKEERDWLDLRLN